MKRLVTLSMLFLIGIKMCFAQYPIPSFNAVVDQRGTFKELLQKQQSCQLPELQRYIHVKYKTTKTLSDEITVYVCSLDGQTTYGPYNLGPGQTLTVAIDEREWGVAIFSDTEVVLDVWIDEQPGVSSE